MLIIESIFEKFTIPEESIIFISNNSRDFGEEPNFHEDLFLSKKISNKFRFKIKNSLTGFLEEYVTPIMKIDEDIKTIPQMSEITGFNISNWVLKEMKDIIYDNGVGYAIMGLDKGYGTAMLHKIDSVKSLFFKFVSGIHRSTHIYEAIFPAEAYVNFLFNCWTII